MNTYFNRFLHHTPSRSGIRGVSAPSLSHSGLTGVSRWSKLATLFDLDHRVKPDGDRKGGDASLKPDGESLCAGRSMVEMLGVLAIIGVLSVGAIAGYSKAMFKYKLNKQTEQLTQVLNTITRLAHSFNNLTEFTYMIPYLIKMGEVPNEMVKQGHNSYIYDIFNNYYYATIQPQSMTDDEKVKGVVAFYIRMPITTKSTENLLMCQNIYNNIKENSANIYYVYSSSGYKTDDARQSKLWGDKYCTSNAKCLKDLSVEKLSEECSLHIGNKSNGHIVVLWKM